MAKVGIELPTGTKAELAERLFAHVRNRTTDLADATMEIDHREYLDDDLGRRERQQLFRRVPVVAAHGSELPNRSDFVTAQLPNNEVLVVRQADGSVRAFVNSCRHRGARLVHDDAGSRKMFTCGYHGWSYAGDGALKVVSGAGLFGELDKSCHGLRTPSRRTSTATCRSSTCSDGTGGRSRRGPRSPRSSTSPPRTHRSRTT